MNLTPAELEFLSAWAREEWQPACYQLPAHRLQLAHRVSGGQFSVFIKAWATGGRKKDQEILDVATNSQPRWPWSTTDEFEARFAEASQWRTESRREEEGSGVSAASSGPVK
jgi:hypothetical protein